MSKELLLQQQRQVNALQNENDIEDKEEKIIKDIEQEIECPRCCEMMAVSSNFEWFCYFQECSLSLLINN
jgi:uncharacterized protein (DUF169 family)